MLGIDDSGGSELWFCLIWGFFFFFFFGRGLLMVVAVDGWLVASDGCSGGGCC